MTTEGTYTIDPEGTLVEVPKEQELEPPKPWHVVFWNDDFTPNVFVEAVLEGWFGHATASAKALTVQIEREGRGIAGTYPYDIAETKMAFVTHIAAKHNHPLRASVEQVE